MKRKSEIPPHIELQNSRQHLARQGYIVEDIDSVLTIHDRIENTLGLYIQNSNQYEPTALELSKKFAKAVRNLKHGLLLELRNQNRAGPIKYDSNPYKQLISLAKLVDTVTNPYKPKQHKISALENYEKLAKANRTFWKANKKFIIPVLITGVCVVLGVAIGTIVPGLGNIVGGIIGAKIGNIVAGTIFGGTAAVLVNTAYSPKLFKKDHNQTVVARTRSIISIDAEKFDPDKKPEYSYQEPLYTTFKSYQDMQRQVFQWLGPAKKNINNYRKLNTSDKDISKRIARISRRKEEIEQTYESLKSCQKTISKALKEKNKFASYDTTACGKYANIFTQEKAKIAHHEKNLVKLLKKLNYNKNLDVFIEELAKEELLDKPNPQQNLW